MCKLAILRCGPFPPVSALILAAGGKLDLDLTEMLG